MQPDAYGRIFLLSHMRALTSLTGHLLGSHPQISGYCELHLAYADVSALNAQRRALADMGALKPRARYLFDKILHNDYVLVPERLGGVPHKILVALQAPAHTLRSIVHLFSLKADPVPYASPGAAGRYYVERLRALAAFCGATSERYAYFDAEALRQSPGRVLSELTDWLGLDAPLDMRYEVFALTGQPRRGDSSPRMFSGVIDATPSDYAHVELPADVLAEATAAYETARRLIVAGADRGVCL